VQITNASIFGVLPEHCTALRALSLSRCRLTDTAASGGLARLLARAPELEELGLGRCKRIADSALAAIGTAPPRLTRAAPPRVVSLIVFCVLARVSCRWSCRSNCLVRFDAAVPRLDQLLGLRPNPAADRHQVPFIYLFLYLLK
jgi:hypothetical protein